MVWHLMTNLPFLFNWSNEISSDNLMKHTPVHQGYSIYTVVPPRATAVWIARLLRNSATHDTDRFCTMRPVTVAQQLRQRLRNGEHYPKGICTWITWKNFLEKTGKRSVSGQRWTAKHSVMMARVFKVMDLPCALFNNQLKVWLRGMLSAAH
jgi:hypothetical protein